ncbi:BON domain-containing protein [Ottowia sp. SB7-C50]|uniref:BON domain-containing protein n=1 Tax=Ottowia sp. SB7-C50 TaxID=3081231 RepID=UPI002954B3FC|nr:BON domain-containing protein [Ottowia sp. SB7-C50]WOP14602.1 BON domain-containing protein [Ottowia sp. SB7-C50]
MNATQPTLLRATTLAAAIALAASLAACNKKDERTAGQQVDSAIAKSEQAAKDAQAKAADAAQEAKVAANRAGAEIKQEAKEMKADASAAIARAGDAASDATTTAAVKAKLVADTELSALQINVDTKDGAVTLTGPAPNATAKARAETIAKSVKGVGTVHNNLTVH